MDMNRKEAGEELILCTKDAKAGKEDWKEVTAVFARLMLLQ